jgi:hypothetical protein
MNLENMDKFQLMTELSKAQRISAEASHTASMSKDNDPVLNQIAISAERHAAHVRRVFMKKMGLVY